MTPNWTQRIRHKKYLTYAVRRTTSPIFSSVSFYDQPFSRNCTFYDFPIDSHVKISKYHKIFKNLDDCREKYLLVFLHCSQCRHRFWLRSDEHRWSSVLKFPAPYVPMLTKISKWHQFFYFWHIAKEVITCSAPPPNYHTSHKIWLKLDESVGVGAFWKF